MTHPAPVSPRTRIFKLLIILFLIGATYIVFSQVLHQGFIQLDDGIYVTNNEYVQRGLTINGFRWAFTAKNDAGFWIPLTWLSLMLDAEIYGMNAGGYHLTNLLIHVINAILIFMVLASITGGLWESAFVAALFALHPLRVESVAWITERKDVLSTLFFLLAIWAYAYYVKRANLKRFLLVFLLFTFGLMAKPMLVTLPFVLLLLDYWPLKRFQSARLPENPDHRGLNDDRKGVPALWLFIEKIPLFILSGIFSIIAFITQKNVGTITSLASQSVGFRIANALISYVKYIWKMLCPCLLGVFYPHRPAFPVWYIPGAAFILLGITYLAIRKVKHAYFFVGWCWYLGTLFPVIGLVQSGSQAMADRFTYVPLIGLFIILAWGLPDILKNFPYRKTINTIVALVAISGLMRITWIQLTHWENSISLFEHALSVTNENWLIHNNLGHSLLLEGKPNEAASHFHEAIKIRPNYAQAHYNLGSALIYQGKPGESIPHFQKALTINPRYAQAHNNLGSVLSQHGDMDKAFFHFYEALRIDPDFAGAHFNLGLTFAKQGDFKKAIHHYKEALRIMPGYAKVHLPLGIAYVRVGDYRAALEEYKSLREIRPDWADILFDTIFVHH